MALIELLLWILAGGALGVFTGLSPGIHLNTMALMVVFFAGKNDFPAVLLIVAMSVMHSFLDFVPSVFLGAPDEKKGDEPSLPGHKMLLKGKGIKAVKLYAVGGLFGILIALALAPFFAALALKWFEFIYSMIPFILALLLVAMVCHERTAKTKIWAVLITALSGALGWIALQNASTGNALFAMISGFFGAATIVYSSKKEQLLKKQKIGNAKYPVWKVLKQSFLGTIAGSIVAFLPSIGASQAAFAVTRFAKKTSTKGYIVLLGAINSSNMFYGFIVLFLIGKARNGSAVAVKQIIELNAGQLLLVIATIMLCTGLAVMAAEFFAEKFSAKIAGINYRKANVAVLAFIAALVVFMTGAQGALLFATSSAIGVIALASKIKRSHCMAFLAVPTIIYYLRF